MPKSTQNKNRAAGTPTENDERRWRRQLESGRHPDITSSSATSNQGRVPAESVRSERADEPDSWRRQLEHNRLSALALPQGTAFAGPGAAPVAAMAAQEAAGAAEAFKAGAGSLEREILKAKAILVTRNYLNNLMSDWLFVWVISPALFFHLITFNGQLKNTAARYKEAARMSLRPPKTPDDAIKMQLQHITPVLMSHWMIWTGWTCFWYGLLMLLVCFIYLIYIAVKCGITAGLWC